MTDKLNRRLFSPLESQNRYQDGIERDLRLRARIMGSYGIVSTFDVDNAAAPLTLSINLSDDEKVDAAPGVVVFLNGEVLDVEEAITGIAVPLTGETAIVRIEYAAIPTGPMVADPYSSYLANVEVSTRPADDSIVVESVASYLGQTQTVKDNSVIIGAVTFVDGELVIDSGRDSLSNARPWFSSRDFEHRSMVGSATPTPQNPHGQELSAFGVGSLSAWQALGGKGAGVISPPQTFGRVPGSGCSETLAAGSFLLDSTGRVTGKAGARYAPLGSWPHTLMRCENVDGDEVAAWIPAGRKVLAIVDPFRFAAPVDVVVAYTTVAAASLPGSIGGASLTLQDPAADEVCIAGGGLLATLSDPVVLFSDVGFVPMGFDIRVDASGKAYKSPSVIFCNTKLDPLGGTPFLVASQPRSPARLRFAVSNFVPAFTNIQFQVSGVDEAGANVSEMIEFTGPIASPTVSVFENNDIRKFTATTYASVTQVQVVARNGDGPNTTVTIFAEESLPDRPGSSGDLTVGSVHWTGAAITDDYAQAAHVAVDRRVVSRGGAQGRSSLPSFYPSFGELTSFDVGSPAHVTLAEDFDDPTYSSQTQSDDPTLPSGMVSIPRGYKSRLIPLATPAALTAVRLHLHPLSTRSFPPTNDATITVSFYNSVGTEFVYNGVVRSGAPYLVELSAVGSPISGTIYAVRVSITPSSTPYMMDSYAGFTIHLR